MSFSQASISYRALLATVAIVGVAGFVVGRESQPPFVISPVTLCSTATEAAFPEETPYLQETDAAMTKMMADMAVKPTGDVDRDFVAMMMPHHQGAIDMAHGRAALRPERTAEAARAGNHRHPAAGDRGDAPRCWRSLAAICCRRRHKSLRGPASSMPAFGHRPFTSFKMKQECRQ